MSRNWKPKKTTVELRPSRIRRDPPVGAAEQERLDKVQWRTPEWEIKLAIIGIIAFALAIDVIMVAISAYTN